MKLNVALTLDLEVDVDNEMVTELSVDGYDLALMFAGMYGDELLKTTYDDNSYRTRINVKHWKIDNNN